MNVFSLCLLLFVLGFAQLSHILESRPERSASVKAVKISIAQLELQAESSPEPKTEPQPDPNPDPNPEPEVEPEPEPMPEEQADVALEKVVETSDPEPEPELKPKSEAPLAQITQEASAQASPGLNTVGEWVHEQIEYEKYYPRAAGRFGLTGTFDVLVTVDPSGMIRSAGITIEGGNRILRQALERTLSRIIGQRYKKPIGEAMEFPVKVIYEAQGTF